jgi:hypothetical protein
MWGLLLWTNQNPTPATGRIWPKPRTSTFGGDPSSSHFSITTPQSVQQTPTSSIHPNSPSNKPRCLVKEDPVVDELPPAHPLLLQDQLHNSKVDQQPPLPIHLHERTKLHHQLSKPNSSKALPVPVCLDRWPLQLRTLSPFPSAFSPLTMTTQRCSSRLLHRTRNRWIFRWRIFSTCC